MDGMNKKVLVLDASAFINLKIPLHPDVDSIYVTTVQVLNELKDRMSKLHASIALMQRIVRIDSPSENSLREVKSILKTLGEKLSETDISVVALALDYKKMMKDVIILTDDYSVSNVAKFLDLKVKPLIRRGIVSIIRWRYQCPSCRRIFREDVGVCPFCGIKLIKRGRRIKPADS
ncbi:MAG: hypothetical protein DRJ49_00570 [Thermoprotei archaeon]|nr:MAG: hypothetical protein DRN53_05920 [Thermoprotei archaeon]RLE90198.1 MAG: hypothetical protein DRJ49_00570 [Thermoprotei archaeon]